ncbi:MAG: TIGR03013 family PEP-CTERM/XrtA system glycosyltransferase [Burkholderiales bacterium]|nr:TIGR03013 family PEP-CTERM/XrtA system glycosyltransferase [Burkholderiales bacterium]OJX08646.1 MAG: exopolysaccharide biosynthesis polyprenyl glycosylphosphotransferase [Burkholderiales bacterium 70-64]
MIRLFNHYLSLRVLLLTLIEAMVLFQSMVLGFEIRFLDQSLPLPVLEAGLFTAVMLLMMTGLGLYDTQAEPFRTTVQRLIVAYSLSLMVMSVVFYLFPDTYVGRGVFAVTSVFAVAGVLVIRVMFFRVTDIGLPKRRVMVLGNGEDAEQTIRFLHDGGRGRTIQYAGLYPVVAERDTPEGERRFDHEHLLRTVKDLRVSEIVLAVRERRGGVLPLRQLLDCKLKGVRVMDLTSFYEREMGVLKIDNLRASWLIFSQGFEQGLLRDMIKRSFDVAVSLILLTLALPVLLLAILAVVLESGRPVFYRQERVGQGGRPFTIMKLRTMVQDAEKDGQPRWAGQNDARITVVGRILRRTRIDELPQLFNVLRGDMSFVGPRPERPFFVRHLLEDIPYYDVRHSVKPGITGWSQVRYPYGASVEDSLAKLQYDLYYVKNHSLFLDLLILVDTVQVVLLGKGAR